MVIGLMLLLLSNTPDVPQDIDILALNAEMEAFLEPFKAEQNPNRKLVELVDVIFNDKWLALTYDNSRTKTAIETFETRNGNCLSFTSMFVAMARHIGLDARFQEVYNFPTWNRKGDTVVLNRHINAVVYTATKRIEIDFNPFRENRAISKSEVSDLRAMAQYYNNIGAELFAAGKREEALLWFQESLNVDDSLSFAWSNLGVNLRILNRNEEAEQAYLKALEVNRYEHTAMANLMKLYEQTGREKEAKRFKRRVDNYNNKNPYYHYMLGERSLEVGDYEGSLAHFRKAIRRKKEEHQFHFAMARAFSHLGMSEQAASSLEKAREFSPDMFNADRYSQKLNMLASH